MVVKQRLQQLWRIRCLYKTQPKVSFSFRTQYKTKTSCSSLELEALKKKMCGGAIISDFIWANSSLAESEPSQVGSVSSSKKRKPVSGTTLWFRVLFIKKNWICVSDWGISSNSWWAKRWEAREEESVQRDKAEAMGQMGSGDSWPEERCTCLAWHIQNRRRSCSSLRRCSHQNPWPESQIEFPKHSSRRSRYKTRESKWAGLGEPSRELVGGPDGVGGLYEMLSDSVCRQPIGDWSWKFMELSRLQLNLLFPGLLPFNLPAGLLTFLFSSLIR